MSPFGGVLAAVRAKGGGKAAAPILNDTFDRADSATLGTATSGQAWAVGVAGWTNVGISSNQAYASAAASLVAWTCDLGVSDIDLRCTVSLGNNSANRVAGLAARVIDTNNYIFAWSLLSTVDATTHRIIVKVNGASQNIDSHTPALTRGVEHTARLVVVGKEIQYIVNGVIAASKTLTEAQYGYIGATRVKHGIYFGQSDLTSRIDNLTGWNALALPLAAVSSDVKAYSSTIDAITNLSMKIAHPQGQFSLPIVALMHGYNGNYLDFTAADYDRMAALGLFIVGVGMRSQNGASGTKDASARELYDIYDAIEFVKTNYPTLVDSTKISLVGYSGGGGNGFGCACKFPDYFNYIASHFGIADYGRDATTGWYQLNSGYRASIAAAVGDTPTNVPDNYYARDHTVAIQNYTGGYLDLFVDTNDTVVYPVNTTRISDALTAAGLSNFTLRVTTNGDWQHGYPSDHPALINSEVIWSARAKSQAAWTIPTSGTITVIGYIKTKRFTIWLNTGLDAAATVVYDTAAGTYKVTPLTSNAVVAVAITQGALTASGNTNGETLFTVS